MAFTEALKPKYGSKHLSTIINAEGKEVQVETRDDEQQKVKYKEIIDILVGAGYYRAKIKGLSEFDKVVGGMTWCIDICNMDLDIDLLFQENSTIGQKISLTEKIVAVLPKMKCPHAIEPHQIQGLDFIHIFPVIEWLVKRSIESREEMGDYLRLYAVHQFDKLHCLPNEKPDVFFIQRGLHNVKTVQDKYSPQRKYRRLEAPQAKDTLSRVEATLFEYGYSPLQEDDNEDENKTEVVDEVRLQKFIKEMTSTAQDQVVGAGTVSSLVSKKVDEIKQAVDTYSTLQAEIEKSGAAEIRRLKEKERELEQEKEQLEKKLASSTEKLTVLEERNFAPASLEDFSEKEKNVVKKMEAMLLTNEMLKEQEQQFKEQCKTELTSLQTMIKETEDVGVDGGGEKETEEVTAQVKEARIELAKTTRVISTLQRKLDQVPTRAELAQYQRRFLELYNQVAAKHRETKQYYTLYNSLNDTHQYLSKELTLLNSILENYNEAMSSPVTKEQFMKQFEIIVDGIKQNKAKVEHKRNYERDHRDKYKTQLQSLVEQQRQYVSVLKQLTQKCRLNEQLAAELKKATKSS